VDVTVRDSKRKSVTGLRASDFEVYDNSVRQEVAEVSYGKLPIDVTVALDVSFSVTGLMLERLRSGVVTLMRDLAREDRLRLMLFNSRVSRVVDFTTDEKKVEAAIKGAAAGGGTALFDSMSVALVSTAPRDRRQLVVVFTDGNDSTSTTQPAMLTNVALRTRAAVAMVLPGNGPFRRHRQRRKSEDVADAPALRRIPAVGGEGDGGLRGPDGCLIRPERRLPPDSRGVQVSLRAAVRRQGR
jgi:VWFA-related protein